MVKVSSQSKDKHLCEKENLVRVPGRTDLGSILKELSNNQHGSILAEAAWE